jgi:hypothetical protein
MCYDKTACTLFPYIPFLYIRKQVHAILPCKPHPDWVTGLFKDIPRVEYLLTAGGSRMKLPFVLPAHHLPVILPCPKVHSRKLIDGTVIYEAHNVRYLNLQSDRDYFEIGFMLEIRQLAALSAAEQFTILALVRLLEFSDGLEFPDFRYTGQLVYVENSDGKFVWATIPSHVIVTSTFTPIDLYDRRMALEEPDVLREIIEQVTQGCSEVDVEKLLLRFNRFKPPHISDIRRALKELPRLGIVREYIQLDRHCRRAMFNMRVIAKTRSYILRGMIAADDHCRRFHGTEVEFSSDICNATPPAKRVNSTTTGRKRKLNRAQYQSLYHSEYAKLIRATKQIAECEENGYLTPEQFAELRKILDDVSTTDPVRETLTLILASVSCDPLTEIPEILTVKDKRHA